MRTLIDILHDQIECSHPLLLDDSFDELESPLVMDYAELEEGCF